jgi:hypothetical protein
VILALPAKRAALAKQAKQAPPAKPAKQAIPAKRARQVIPVKLALKAPLDLPANPVQMVLLDPRVQPAKRAQLEVLA